MSRQAVPSAADPELAARVERALDQQEGRLGKVEVDMHGTTCKVPLALENIQKVEKAGRVGKKRKTIRC